MIVGSGETAKESGSEARVCCRVWLDSIVINKSIVIVINIILNIVILINIVLLSSLAGQHCY